jgi:general secretion pathway protein J
MRDFRNRGFTLLEMVVAVAIFAIMAAIAYTGLNHTIKVGNQVNESNLRLSELQFALSYFSRDWLQVSSRKVRNQYGDEENNIILADNSVSFTRSGWANLLQRKRSNLQRVQYLLVDNKLVRRHWLSLDQGIGEEPLESVLLNNVNALEVEFVDASEKAIDAWPGDLVRDERQPIALKIGVDINQLGKTWRYLEIPNGAL